MKITTAQLRQIIREEIQKMSVNEAGNQEIRLKGDYEKVKKLMDKYKNGDAVEDFIPFGKDLAKVIGGHGIKFAPNAKEGLYSPFVWAVDNTAVSPLESGIKVTLRGGPKGKWVYRGWN
jgi:hypothetical protein